ncbi:aquaporin-11-like isoform X2 [Agrilus planipennis]|uniref:Aquaporin n=1 Tax=Agrilus planipennis TaxID=224129 RepID=A0A1W4XMM0_AGRPL|nr:aquaporin-11-like isoform X2 [Agrilus planipennis]
MNQKKNLGGVHPLVISTLFLCFTSVLASSGRRLVKTRVKHGLWRDVALEFIATAELCACCFELIIVADNYGVSTYALFLFLLTIWWSLNWENATACPYNAVEEVFMGSKGIIEAFMMIAAQVLGGVVIFSYVQMLWIMELAETHKGRAFEECVADLNVPMITGAIIEGTATCLCRIVSRGLNDMNLPLATVLDALFATTLVVAAFNFSGGYFNPALATSLKLGCKGHNFTEHMVVYWLGATVGSLMSVFLYRLPVIQRVVNKRKYKKT